MIVSLLLAFLTHDSLAVVNGLLITYAVSGLIVLLVIMNQNNMRNNHDTHLTLFGIVQFAIIACVAFSSILWRPLVSTTCIMCITLAHIVISAVFISETLTFLVPHRNLFITNLIVVCLFALMPVQPLSIAMYMNYHTPIV